MLSRTGVCGLSRQVWGIPDTRTEFQKVKIQTRGEITSLVLPLAPSFLRPNTFPPARRKHKKTCVPSSVTTGTREHPCLDALRPPNLWTPWRLLLPLLPPPCEGRGNPWPLVWPILSFQSKDPAPLLVVVHLALSTCNLLKSQPFTHTDLLRPPIPICYCALSLSTHSVLESLFTFPRLPKAVLTEDLYFLVARARRHFAVLIFLDVLVGITVTAAWPTWNASFTGPVTPHGSLHCLL